MSKNTVRTSVSLSEEHYGRINEIAEQNDVSVAWVIRKAIQKYLDAQQNEQIPLPIIRENSKDA